MPLETSEHITQIRSTLAEIQNKEINPEWILAGGLLEAQRDVAVRVSPDSVRLFVRCPGQVDP